MFLFMNAEIRSAQREPRDREIFPKLLRVKASFLLRLLLLPLLFLSCDRGIFPKLLRLNVDLLRPLLSISIKGSVISNMAL
jgi:hypothetical protein